MSDISKTQIYGGKVVDLLSPRVEDVSIEHIARSLSKQCRFNGNTRKFFSVAQHSVIASQYMPEDFRIYGLLHDAHEAFIGDISTPVKRLLADTLGRDVIKEVAEAWDEVIFEALNLKPPSKEILAWIKATDREAMVIEASNLMWDCKYWVYNPSRRFKAWSSEEAYEEFMQAYNNYIEDYLWI